MKMFRIVLYLFGDMTGWTDDKDSLLYAIYHWTILTSHKIGSISEWLKLNHVYVFINIEMDNLFVLTD